MDLYPEFLRKIACLGFSLIQNHPFIDGNKRTGHAAMEVVMLLNGVELVAGVDESEAVVLKITTGALDRESLARWLAEHQVPSSGD